MAPYNLEDWQLREIKSQPIIEEELEAMHQLTGSYEALFSRKSSQIKQRGIEVNTLKESDYKALLLDHYTFLKRPVFLTENHIFIGNDKANLEKLEHYFDNE